MCPSFFLEYHWSAVGCGLCRLNSIKSRLPPRLQSLSNATLLSLGAVGVAALVCVTKTLTSSSPPPPQKQKWAPSGSGRHYSLLPGEKSPFMENCPSIGGCNVYEGTPPIAAIQSRLDAVVAANPWLQTRLVSSPTEKVLAWVPSEPGSIPVEVGTVDLDHLTSQGYDRYVAGLSHLSAPTLSQALDADVCLFRLHVLTIPGPTKRFAIVTSLCHAIADGGNFYRLHGLLSTTSQTPPASLVFDRIPTFLDMMATRGSVDQINFNKSTTLIVGMMRNLLLRPRHVSCCYEVNMEYVAKLKAEHVPTAEAPFLSTNDVVTYCFFTGRGLYEYGGLVLDLRRRLAGVGADRVGNIVHVHGLWIKHVTSPAVVRNAVSDTSVNPTGTAAPSLFNAVFRSNWAVITNWATFHEDLEVEGCTYVQHMPLYDMSTTSLRGFSVVFKSGGKVCVMLAEEDYSRDGAPWLGKRIM